MQLLQYYAADWTVRRFGSDLPAYAGRAIDLDGLLRFRRLRCRPGAGRANDLA